MAVLGTAAGTGPARKESPQSHQGRNVGLLSTGPRCLSSLSLCTPLSVTTVCRNYHYMQYTRYTSNSILATSLFLIIPYYLEYRLCGIITPSYYECCLSGASSTSSVTRHNTVTMSQSRQPARLSAATGSRLGSGRLGRASDWLPATACRSTAHWPGSRGAGEPGAVVT